MHCPSAMSAAPVSDFLDIPTAATRAKKHHVACCRKSTSCKASCHGPSCLQNVIVAFYVHVYRERQLLIEDLDLVFCRQGVKRESVARWILLCWLTCKQAMGNVI